MNKKFKKIGCIADLDSEIALTAYKELIERYELLDAKNLPLDHCDLIIMLGGDGMMLRVMHSYMHTGIPIFGMNRGSIGFLLNEYKLDSLMERVHDAEVTKMYPLEMKVTTQDMQVHTELAINEVSLLRETSQTAKIQISVNDEVRLESLVADGVLLATPAGSSAYNFAAYGPIIPLGSNVMALTPICPFRPRRWRGALLSQKSKVRFDIIDHDKRPVSAVADSSEYRDVVAVEVRQRQDIVMNILFDKSNGFEERVLEEQFND